MGINISLRVLVLVGSFKGFRGSIVCLILARGQGPNSGEGGLVGATRVQRDGKLSGPRSSSQSAAHTWIQ